MKTKLILVVLGTLIIGFILGMLTSAQIRYHRLNPVRVFFSEERFREGFFRTIQPNEQQKEKINLVLDKYAKINSELQNNFRKELDASMKDFRKELDLNLTKEQIERLKVMDERRQMMLHQYRKNHEEDTLNSRDERRHNPDRRPGQDRQHPPFSNHDTLRLPDLK